MQRARSTSVTELRASLRAASGKPEPDLPKPPKPRKNKRAESDEERMQKAERAAMAQHTTSLLKGGNPNKPYVRPGERPERKGGLVWQLLLVVVVAGGVAYALDPSIVPPEWTDTARDFVGQYIKI